MVTYRDEGATTLWVSIFFFFGVSGWRILIQCIYEELCFLIQWSGLDNTRILFSQPQTPTQKRTSRRLVNDPSLRNDLPLYPKGQKRLAVDVGVGFNFLALQIAHNDPVFFSSLVWASPISMA